MALYILLRRPRQHLLDQDLDLGVLWAPLQHRLTCRAELHLAVDPGCQVFHRPHSRPTFRKDPVAQATRKLHSHPAIPTGPAAQATHKLHSRPAIPTDLVVRCQCPLHSLLPSRAYPLLLHRALPPARRQPSPRLERCQWTTSCPRLGRKEPGGLLCLQSARGRLLGQRPKCPKCQTWQRRCVLPSL